MSLFVSRTYRDLARSSQVSSLSAGRIPVTSPVEARRLLMELGLERAESGGDERAASAGELASLALLEDVYQTILAEVLGPRDPSLLKRVLAVLRARLGMALVDRLLMEFAEEYLGASFGDLAARWLGEGKSDLDLDRNGILRQVIVFWLLHTNRAARPIVSRLHRAPLLSVPAFQEMVDMVCAALEREPGEQKGDAGLWDLLTRPLRNHPDSLVEQLAELRRQWRGLLAGLDDRLTATLGMVAEEQAPRFPPGPGPTALPTFDDLEGEVRFSDDRNWMSSLVLVAKHTLVWLDQLSDKYGSRIVRLDQIPSAELEYLSALGFNGLWLIGLWERSPASEEIKRRMGNPEAAASAYSLVRYQVADALGGEPALETLRQRAASVGIRLAADMVPNHTGLDSDWMIDHPDWFIQVPECPFPAYRFTGPDLSRSPRIALQLEDHYFDRSDAAVVFQRTDRESGEVRYIYHGNDGTSMPWNDTAQLDYLNPRVWDAVIDTIVAVARRFPVIRFDAAMTLTRRHYQRLWFPDPGAEGAIPSRADHGMSKEAFLEHMPQEFWRQVVDRLAEEAPDTLLLAEAFWLMEGFFVRTLGMHRVYNSAFMNMLRDGETAKYRQLIKETLRFDPGILKRYVNFMSNPDEATAIEQFGDSDRYLGTCVVLATLPGLPMFGHGQVEGLRERFGMEYRRAYSGESPRSDLIARHRQQIAPLLHARAAFAEVEHFRLFDCITSGGGVDEDVLAYSNGEGSGVNLVLFNNSDRRIEGRLMESVAMGDNQRATRIGEALSIPGQDFWRCRDVGSGRTFVLDGARVFADGLAVDLEPWESRVLHSFGALELEWELAAEICRRVGWRGTTDLEGELRKIELEPLQLALAEVLDVDLLGRLMALPGGLSELRDEDDLVDDLRNAVKELTTSLDLPVAEPLRHVLALVTLPELARRLSASKRPAYRDAGAAVRAALDRHPEVLPLLFCWSLLTTLLDGTGRSPATIADWELESRLLPSLLEAGGEHDTIRRLVPVLELALVSGWGRTTEAAPPDLDLQRQILTDEDARRTLGAHSFEGREYIVKEALEAIVDWRLLLEAFAWSAAGKPVRRVPAAVSEWSRVLGRFASDAERALYRTDEMSIVRADAISASSPSSPARSDGS